MYLEVETLLSTIFHNRTKAFHWSRIIHLTTIMLLLILCIALFLRMQFFVGLGFADDEYYARTVHQILEGTFVPAKNVFDTRISFIYPIAFLTYLLGYGEFSLTLFPLLCSLGEIILIYKLGEMFFSKKAGLVAALLLSCYPLDIIYSTNIMPDIPLALFTGLNAYFLIRAEAEQKRLFFIVAGLFLGLSYLIKPVAVMQAIPCSAFFLGYSIIKKRINTSHILFFIALFSVFLLEALYYKAGTGYFFRHFSIISETYNKGLYQGNRLQDVIEYYPKLIFLFHYSHFKYLFGLFFYCGAFAACYYACQFFRRKKREPAYSCDRALENTDTTNRKKAQFLMNRKSLYVLAVWLLFWVAYLQFGSMSFKKYIIMEKHERFLSLITIPFLLMLSFFLTSYKTRIWNGIKILFVAVLFTSSLYFAHISSVFHGVEIRDVRDIKKYLDNKTFSKIYADRETNHKLDFLSGFKKRGMLVDLNIIGDVSQIQDNSYVITQGKGFIDLAPSLKNQLTNDEYLWGKGWKLEEVIDKNLLKEFKINKPRIYYVP